MITQPLAPAADPASSAGTSDRFHWLQPVQAAALASGTWPLAPDPAPSEWTCYPRVAIRTPGVDAQAVPAAREFTIATLRRWGMAHRSADIAVVVSELLTNALRHALPPPGQILPRQAIRLGLLQPGPCVLCAVADPSRRPPEPEKPGCLAETGRGLHIVDAFSDRWGYAALGERGKVVWAIFSAVPQQTRAGSSEPS